MLSKEDITLFHQATEEINTRMTRLETLNKESRKDLALSYIQNPCTKIYFCVLEQGEIGILLKLKKEEIVL